MRVIGGEFRSRKLKPVPGLGTRPTPDRLRESLFNIVASRLAGSVFLDAYAGTGAVGIEALSRGARRALFIERNRGAAGILRENLASLALTARAEVFTAASLKVLDSARADIVFLDPPYELEPEYALALDSPAAQNAPLVIVQHASKLELPASCGKLGKVRVVRQGDNSLSFYEPV